VPWTGFLGGEFSFEGSAQFNVEIERNALQHQHLTEHERDHVHGAVFLWNYRADMLNSLDGRKFDPNAFADKLEFRRFQNKAASFLS
jgi:hypothetical protein